MGTSRAVALEPGPRQPGLPVPCPLRLPREPAQPLGDPRAGQGPSCCQPARRPSGNGYWAQARPRSLQVTPSPGHETTALKETLGWSHQHAAARSLAHRTTVTHTFCDKLPCSGVWSHSCEGPGQRWGGGHCTEAPNPQRAKGNPRDGHVLPRAARRPLSCMEGGGCQSGHNSPGAPRVLFPPSHSSSTPCPPALHLLGIPRPPPSPKPCGLRPLPAPR